MPLTDPVTAIHKRVRLKIVLNGTNRQFFFTVNPNADAEDLMMCAEALNAFQTHSLKDIFRVVNMELKVGAN